MGEGALDVPLADLSTRASADEDTSRWRVRTDAGEVDVRSVIRVNYGGAPIAPALVRRIQEGFPNAEVGNGFGLTETASIATYLPHAWAAEHAEYRHGRVR